MLDLHQSPRGTFRLLRQWIRLHSHTPVLVIKRPRLDLLSPHLHVGLQHVPGSYQAVLLGYLAKVIHLDPLSTLVLARFLIYPKDLLFVVLDSRVGIFDENVELEEVEAFVGQLFLYLDLLVWLP